MENIYIIIIYDYNIYNNLCSKLESDKVYGEK